MTDNMETMEALRVSDRFGRLDHSEVMATFCIGILKKEAV